MPRSTKSRELFISLPLELRYSDAICPFHSWSALFTTMFAFSFEFIGIDFFRDTVLMTTAMCLEVGQGISRETIWDRWDRICYVPRSPGNSRLRFGLL